MAWLLFLALKCRFVMVAIIFAGGYFSGLPIEVQVKVPGSMLCLKETHWKTEKLYQRTSLKTKSHKITTTFHSLGIDGTL